MLTVFELHRRARAPYFPYRVRQREASQGTKKVFRFRGGLDGRNCYWNYLRMLSNAAITATDPIILDPSLMIKEYSSSRIFASSSLKRTSNSRILRSRYSLVTKCSYRILRRALACVSACFRGTPVASDTEHTPSYQTLPFEESEVPSGSPNSRGFSFLRVLRTPTKKIASHGKN